MASIDLRGPWRERTEACIALSKSDRLLAKTPDNSFTPDTSGLPKSIDKRVVQEDKEGAHRKNGLQGDIR